jgi:hypothetical protein
VRGAACEDGGVADPNKLEDGNSRYLEKRNYAHP